MNINTWHDAQKSLSTKVLFQAPVGKVISIVIEQGEILKEHSVPQDALLVCVAGEVLYSDANSIEAHLLPNEFVNITASVVHKLTALQNSSLILIR